MSFIALPGYAKLISTVSTQAGTTYTVSQADAGSVLYFTSNSPITLTAPNSPQPGFNALVIQGGTGQITFAAGSGATIRNRQLHTKTAGQYSVISLVVGTNTTGSAAVYFLSGDGST